MFSKRIYMSPRILFIVFGLLISGPVFSQNDTTSEVDLFIVAGQSNAVGFDAKPTELPADPTDEKVMFWWRTGDPPPDDHDTTSGGWTTLKPQPLGNPKQPRDSKERQYGNFAQPEGGFGPEMGFARTLLAAQPDRRIAIVKAAFSGTGIARDWDPEKEGEKNSCYGALISEIRKARGDAEKKGLRLVPKALLWVQGESDANPNDAPKYADRLNAMVASIREDLGAPELMALVAVNTRFGLGENPHMPAIVAAQQEAASRGPKIVYVDTSAATVVNYAHFGTQGTLDVGRWFAEALLQMEAAPEPLADGVTVERGIAYATFGDRKVAMDLFHPAGDGLHPGILLVHGGGWTSGNRQSFEAFAIELAKRGYVVANIDYRLATEAKFPAAVLDCKAAVRWLRSNAARLHLDPGRIAGVGGSAGGHLVGMVATTGHDPTKFEEADHSPGQSSALQAAVLMGAGVDQVTRVKETKGQRIENCVVFFGAEFSENPDIYAQGSPITHVSKRTPPILFLDGGLDMPGERYVDMRERLDALGVLNEFTVIDGAKHGQWGREPWLTPYIEAIDVFLRKTLVPK